MTLRWYHRLAIPLVPALLLPFLAAPTCQGPVVGPRQFGDDSIVIPMDECWQPYSQQDIEPTTVPLGGAGSACSATYTHGALNAYGLVYYLIQNNVPVYWIINQGKVAVTDVDLSIPGATSQGNLFDWAQVGGAGTATGAAHLGAALGVEPTGSGATYNYCPQAGLCYRGGPFVIDGSDFQTVYNLLSSGGVFTQFANEVQMHVIHPTTPYTGYVAKTLEGTPPQIAILGIPGEDCTDTSPILTSYLADAALSSANVFAVLYASDFNYTTGTLAGSNLAKYQLLWAPHWMINNGAGTYASTNGAPFTCPGTRMTAAQATNVMTVISQYVAAGNNLFAECIGLGSMEGDNEPGQPSGGGAQVETNLVAGTEFESTAGNLNASANAAGAPVYSQVAASFLQIGDFPFTPTNGKIAKFQEQTGWRAGEQTFVSDATGWDVLTEINNGGGVAGHGTVVYMGGHSYEHTAATQNVAGERMVLNTLFTLAAACTVPSPATCNTGLLGVCAAGTYQCQNGTLTCVENVQPSPETCDGLDNDCNGLVDDGVPPKACYSGPAGTQNCLGAAGAGFACGCSAGSEFCVNGVYGVCQGEVDPSPEVCDGIDNNCDGLIDNQADGGPLAQACYDGPAGTEGVGLCVGGNEVCSEGGWSACTGEVLPAGGFCDGLDHECNGMPSMCQNCTLGQMQPCYTGPAGTLGVGLCKAGTATCGDAGTFGVCSGQVTPAPDTCDGLDHACTGLPDNCPACDAGATMPCYTGPTGTEGVGICKGGTETCSTMGAWGPCVGETLPGTQYCDGKDDTCDGMIDQGAICPTTEVCVNGNCVPESCGGGEFGTACPSGYTCTSGSCVAGGCGDAGICPTGQTCKNGVCIDPCQGVKCGSGSFCSDGTCVSGGCYATGCDGGVCSLGQCIANPCTGVTCPDGTFCRSGFCVQDCAFVTCPSGQVCDVDGNCTTPACGGCPAGKTCQNGTCATDPCTGVGCAQGQICSGGVCIDDPCNGIVCPGIQACVDGQCVDQARDGGGLGSSGGNGGSAGSSSGGGASSSANTGTASSGGSSGGAGSSGGSGTGSGGSGVDVGKSGCNCGTGSGPGAVPTILLGLGLLVGRSRRRRKTSVGERSVRGRASLVITAALALLSISCSQTTPPGSTSGSNGGSNGASTQAGGSSGATGGSSTAAGSSSTGGGGCTLCNGACANLATDPANCGACGKSCPSGEVCVLGACGDDTGVVPVLVSISPTTAEAGAASVPLTLTGQHFLTGAQVVIQGDGLAATALPATLNANGTLSATANFATAGPGTVTVAVLDPQKLLSNSLPLTLAAAGSPILTSISPTSSPAGVTVALTLTGQNFISSSEVHVEGGAVPDTALTATIKGTTSATTNWDLTGITPGTYSFFIVNPGTTNPTSNTVSFQVASSTPILTSIMPNTGPSNGNPALTLVGSGFDASSIVEFGAAAATPTAQPTTLVSGTGLFASLDLTNVAPGSYQVTVQNAGMLTSQPQAFTVVSSTPSIDQVTPDSAPAGSTPAVNLLGQGFDPSSVVHFQNSSGGGDVAMATTYVGAGSLTVASLSLVGVTVGSYQLVVVNSGPLTAAAFPFQVTTNTPVLSGVSPSTLSQSSSATVITLTGLNFENGATAQLVPLSTGTAASWPLTVTTTNSAVTTAAINPAVLGVDSYEITLTNPGAAVSNPATFSITPGTPVLTSITPGTAVSGSCATGTCAGTCTAPTIQLTGQFFTPTSVVHVTGLNGSVVVPSSFVSATQLNAAPSLCGASPDSYAVTVWNSSTLQSGVQNFIITGP